MNFIKRNIPNCITISNLLFGLSSIYYCLYFDDIEKSSYCIFFGAILDFFDGYFARLLDVKSNIGKQLDSLSDMVTFGIAPGFIILQLIMCLDEYNFYESTIIIIISSTIPICAGIRLSKFNINDNQSISFIGLPTPITGIFIASIPLIQIFYSIKMSANLLLGSSLFLSFLMISNLPLLSLKSLTINDLKNKNNIIVLLLIFLSILLLCIFHFIAIPFIVILYLTLSIINNLTK